MAPKSGGNRTQAPPGSPDMFDLSPETRIRCAAATRDAEEAAKLRKTTAKSRHEQDEKEGEEDNKAGEQLLQEAGERLWGKWVGKHNTDDPRGTPTREEKKRRRNLRHPDTRESKENDRKRGYKQTAKEQVDIGDHKKGDQDICRDTGIPRMTLPATTWVAPLLPMTPRHQSQNITRIYRRR